MPLADPTSRVQPPPAVEKNLHNIAFTAFLQLGEIEACVDLLVATDRIPEAALLARTYAPSLAPAVVDKWAADLAGQGKKKIARAIVNPAEDAAAFDEDWAAVLALEANGGVPQDTDDVEPAAENGADEVVEDDDEDDEPERAASPAKATAADSDDVPVLAPVIDKVEEIVDGVKELAVGATKAPESQFPLRSCPSPLMAHPLY